MNISLVISQIRQIAAVFNGNVAGAAEYASGVEDQVWLPMPAAYVIPLEEEASENQSMNGLWQISTESVGIIVLLDNTADRRGQAPVATLDQVKASLFTAILNWRPDSSADNATQPAGNPEQDHETRGFRLERGGIIAFDRARLRYQWDFALDVTFTDADGWQPPATPLTEIQGYLTEFGQLQITGDLVKGQTTVFNVSSIANLEVGALISGTGVPVGATIANPPPSGSRLTLSAPATATNSQVALTVTPASPVQPSFDIQLTQS